MTGIYLALGANLGDRRANLSRALVLLAPEVRVEAISGLYESPPQPPAPPPDYLNCACRVSTELEPLDLLAHAKGIEREMGREPSRERWAPRPVDIDIVLYGDRVIESEELTIPHPRLIERVFVLQPLLDIDPDLVHPVTGERLADVLARVGLGGLIRVGEPGWESA